MGIGMGFWRLGEWVSIRQGLVDISNGVRSSGFDSFAQMAGRRCFLWSGHHHRDVLSEEPGGIAAIVTVAIRKLISNLEINHESFQHTNACTSHSSLSPEFLHCLGSPA